MIISDVAVLKEAASDLENGFSFYDSRETGVGNYFWDSLISDIESLSIFAGIHVKEHGIHRMLSKNFPYAVRIMKLTTILLLLSQYCQSAVIPSG